MHAACEEEARDWCERAIGVREIGDLAPPPGMRLALATKALPSGEGLVQAWLAFADTESALHRDPPHGVLVCLAGEKRIGLLPPAGRSILTATFDYRSGHFMGDNKFRRNYDLLTDGHRYDGVSGRYAGVRGVFKLRRGQAILIPSGWWHQVSTPKGGVAISIPVNFV